MTEVFSFNEGAVHIYAGVTGSSGSPIAYVQNCQLSFNYGWDTSQSLSGTYRDHLTGQAAQASINAGYTFDKTLLQRFNSATAVHFKFIQSGIHGTGGYFLFSGRLDSLSFNAQQGGVFMFTLAGHANRWSAF